MERLLRSQYTTLGLPRHWRRVSWPSVGVPTLDRPKGGDNSEGSGTRQHRQAVHEPDHRIATGVAPEDIGKAVRVEVTGFRDRPGGGYQSEPPGRRLDRQAVHE